jgi:hypothetical protein
MSPSVTSPNAVLKYELEVGDQGRVEMNVPFAKQPWFLGEPARR